MVHAAEDEVGASLEEGAEGEEDAVGGRPVHLEGTVGAPHRPQGPVERQRMAGAALLPIWGNDGHLRHTSARLGEEPDPGSEDAVIVGDEDVHEKKITGARGAKGARGVLCQYQAGGAAFPSSHSCGPAIYRGPLPGPFPTIGPP